MDLKALNENMETWCHRNACGYGTRRAARQAWAKPKLGEVNTHISDLEKSLKEEGISTEEVRRRVKTIRNEKIKRDHLIGLVVGTVIS